MKLANTFSLILSATFLIACQTTRAQKDKISKNPNVMGSIEITNYDLEKNIGPSSLISGTIVDENSEPIVGMTATLKGTDFGAVCDLDGRFLLKEIPPGSYWLEFKQLGTVMGSVELHLNSGDQVKMEAVIAIHVEIELLKPIIYVYPEKKTEVAIELIYDGEITTTYPSYPNEGWKVNASPDGTLIDQDDKEYYALYWEGEPREPLGINNGFVVSKEQTIPFLEEKLSLLGLNAKESNEFIIFWLPILEKNAFNLIHFADQDYLEQAKLKISPTPETMIRIAMVFKGLEEEIDVPIQDLTPLKKSRSGFTVVEWGGQELPKEYKLGI